MLFDIDGTLCDSDPLHYHAYREMLQEVENLLLVENVGQIYSCFNVLRFHYSCHILGSSWEIGRTTTSEITNRNFDGYQIGFNGGAPITEEFFIETIAGKHNDDIALALFPNDLERGLKFVDDKEAMFRR